MLIGTVSNYMAQQFDGNPPPVLPWIGVIASAVDADMDSDDGNGDDASPIPGPKTETMIRMAAKHRES